MNVHNANNRKEKIFHLKAKLRPLSLTGLSFELNSAQDSLTICKIVLSSNYLANQYSIKIGL